jgi:uncharacterized oxidoreductase
MELTGRTWLITGGSAGIGLALANAVAERGNTVIICGRNQQNLDKAHADNPRLVTRQCDVADPESRAAMVRWLEQQHPDLSVLVNNAGVQVPRTFGKEDATKGLESEITINLTAPIHLIHALLPLLRRQPEASIVNVTSGLAYAPIAVFPVYCATKAALHSFTMTLRYQLRRTRIAVIEMAPPLVATGLRSQETADGNPATDGAVTPEQFVAEALPLLEAGSAEVLVGQSVGTRARGETLFDLMNTQDGAK